MLLLSGTSDAAAYWPLTMLCRASTPLAFIGQEERRAERPPYNILLPDESISASSYPPRKDCGLNSTLHASPLRSIVGFYQGLHICILEGLNSSDGGKVIEIMPHLTWDVP